MYVTQHNDRGILALYNQVCRTAILEPDAPYPARLTYFSGPVRQKVIGEIEGTGSWPK
jgi:hypothetical protein